MNGVTSARALAYDDPMSSSIPTPSPSAPSAARSSERKAKAIAWLKEAALMVGVAGAVLLGVAALKGRGGSPVVDVDGEAPAFRVARADGSGEVSSDDLRGKPVVLTFWATWCPACRDELPELEALSKRVGADIAIVPVSRENAATVQGFAARKGMTMPLYVGGSAFQAYRIESIPTTIVIDARGRVLAEITGGADADKLEEIARRGGGGGSPSGPTN